MIYPNMLPSKSPTSQSPFLLAPGRGNEVLGGASQGTGLDGDENDSPHSGLSPHLGGGATIAGAGGVGVGPTSLGGSGPAAAAGGSTATAAAKVERYRPRIFGFPTHETAKLHRWQERQRDTQIERLEHAESTSTISVAPEAGVGAGVRTGLGTLD